MTGARRRSRLFGITLVFSQSLPDINSDARKRLGLRQGRGFLYDEVSANFHKELLL